MQAGRYDLRINIERKAVTADPVYGTETVTWELFAAVWANVYDTPPSRSEAVKTGLSVATQQSKVTIRYLAGVDSAMRVIISRPDATTYQIVGGPAVIGRNKEIEMMVEKASV